MCMVCRIRMKYSFIRPPCIRNCHLEDIDFSFLYALMNNIFDCYYYIFVVFFSFLSRLEGILEFLPKKDKRNVLAMLQTYWLLKRRSRNGLPLLRRLQVSMPPPATTKVDILINLIFW